MKKQIDKGDKTIWIHAASLGEYEQGLPLLEELKKKYTKNKIVLSFFSPSGYEVKKDKTPADVVIYLPMDTIANAKQFVALIKPELAIFIKYEIWPSYLRELKKCKVPALLASAIFSRKQIFFKPYGGFMRKSLKNISHFFVQDDNSKDLLNTIGFKNCTISGDTRFDRVFQILKNDNELVFMATFKGEHRCMIAGSTWPEDETIIVDYINQINENVKFVIAPHHIKSSHIEKLVDSINKKTIRYSKMKEATLDDVEVLIIDSIGLLTKIYNYADIAYVGGGFSTGLHNTLEPAVFGIPVIIGPKYDGFKEAEDLVELNGIISISNKNEFRRQLDALWSDNTYSKNTGKINADYIQKKQGATKEVMSHIVKLL
ncbi:3-deoxy-D-manno-octulosonic acid transferase [Croceitalea rosinachiae]|uniref:3-deoxy-D-manno-octulosonic acid transferase n=1 Tax=Croceitalea rosinachiae TaxID=3075596 RepID=A0ABU3A9I2_9FLAO|nr:glycosyltransferase N-terminal domain-containing protein [Croceitalea sp. F388]MDT0605743.1 glycosyltransferase N-terminal domain-containing protein [Croceitalea sp. F388]